MELHDKPIDAYRVFFPLGILLGTAGVSIWPFYHYGAMQTFSGRAHAFVQTDGFLYCFIVGFLMTAIPRFTGTPPPVRSAQYALAALLAAASTAFELHYFAAGHTAFLAAHVFLMVLAFRRFARRQAQPPETFPLVGLGLTSGLAGAVINAGIAWEVIPPFWDPLGKRLLTEGMMLLLVLGVGGFLGPRLLGFAAIPRFDAIQGKPNYILQNTIVGLAVLISLVAEYGFSVPGMAFSRAAIATGVILSNVQPWRLPALRTTLAWCVWTAHWHVIVALWLVAILPRYTVDFLHILFIGGFTLLIFAVGMRVTLSHGGHALALERRSWPLRIGLTTGLAAMVARAGAPFAGYGYFQHLAWAGLLWIGGMLFWGYYVFRLIRNVPEKNPN